MADHDHNHNRKDKYNSDDNHSDDNNEKHNSGGATFAGHSTGHSMQSITNGGDWDVVVLQGQSQRSSFGSGYVNHYIVPETVILGNAIKATNPCIMPLFYQTWGKRDGDSQNCGNHELFCSYEGIQDQLTQSYNTYAYVNQPAKVAPVGEAWRTYSNRNSLFAGDGSHASSKGWFLAACVMFEQIWGLPASASTYTEGDDLKAQATAIVNDGRQWSWPGGAVPIILTLQPLRDQCSQRSSLIENPQDHPQATPALRALLLVSLACPGLDVNKSTQVHRLCNIWCWLHAMRVSCLRKQL